MKQVISTWICTLFLLSIAFTPPAHAQCANPKVLLTGGFPSANGTQALHGNNTGHDNTANGAFALESNSTGDGNTATGAFALQSNATVNGCSTEAK